MLDEEEQSELDLTARQEAEREMRKRDRDEGYTTGKMRRGLLYGMSKSKYSIKLCTYKSL